MFFVESSVAQATSRSGSRISARRAAWLALVLGGISACDAPVPVAPALKAPVAARTIAASSTTIDLGSLGSGITLATAIGRTGYITGASAPAGASQEHAMLWSASTGMRDLGYLGDGAIGLAVNGKGEVAGVYYPPNLAPPRAFFWSEKTGMIDIGVLPGGTTSTAKGINDAGTVVGWADDSQGGLHPFAWTLVGGMKILPSISGAGGGGATAINSLGAIVGWSRRADGSEGATRWLPGRPPQDLGQPGVTSDANAINDLGLVVGDVYLWVNGVFTQHAMYWRESTGMVDIGTLGGRAASATAVNNAGSIFGYSDYPGGTSWHAFEWNAGIGMKDIFPATGFSWISGVQNRTVVAYSGVAVKLP